MNTKSVKWNVVMNTILTVSSLIFPLITFPYASRILHPEGIGRVSFATSVVYYFNIFAQLGIPTYGIRTCARCKNKDELSKTVHELFLINIFFTLLTYIIYTASMFLIPRFSEERELLFILSATILLNTLGMEWLYKGLEKYQYITVRSLAFKVIAVILLLLLVRKAEDYIIYGGITIFAASASNIFNLVHSRKYLKFKRYEHYELKKHMKPIFVFFAMAVASTIYTNLDVVMVGFIKTNIDVGFYNSAVKVKNILVGIVTSMGAVLLPRSSSFIAEGKKEEFFNVSRKAINCVFIIAVPLIVFFSIFAKYGVLLLSGDDFLEAVPAMIIIMPTILFIGITNILGIQMLVPLNREKIVLISEIVGAVIDFILNMIFIPMWGAAGAALGTLVAEIGVFIVQTISMRNDLSKIFRGINYLEIIIANIIAVAGTIWILRLNISVLVAFLIAGILYFGIYLSFLLIRKNSLLIEVLNSVKSFLLKK